MSCRPIVNRRRACAVVGSTPTLGYVPAGGLRADRRLRDGRAGRPGRARSTGCAGRDSIRAACFAALLGTARARPLADRGRRSGRAHHPRATATSTLILETRIETGDGVVTVIDFMPPRGRNSDVVRLVRGERGRVRDAHGARAALRLRPRDPVGEPARRRHAARHRRAGHGDVAHAGAATRRGSDDRRRSSRSLPAQTVPFVLTHGPSHQAPPAIDRPRSSRCADTESFWTEWVEPSASPTGEWADAVTRSLITLKALTYAPTGGIVAAPTTSLPEQIGGERNWDYRFCWLRDATSRCWR